MAIIRNAPIVLVLAYLSGSTLAMPERRDSSCYSYTATTPYTGAVWCPNKTACGPAPACITVNTITLDVPCADPRCPKTPMVTVTGPATCTTCRTGCATSLTTATMTTGCASATPL